MTADLTPAAQAVLDAFVPAPSVVNVMDPTAEAKAAAVAAGVEDATARAISAELVPGVPFVWVVVGGTREDAFSFVALVSTDERRAWVVALDLAAKTRGVRVERHPLI